MIKKLSISLLSIMILSGCTVDYSINIDKDLIVDESIKINELTNTILTQTLDVDIFLDKAIDNYQNDPRYDLYMYEKYTDDSETYVTAKAYYLDFNAYLENKKIKDTLFENFNIIKEGNTYNFVYVAKNSKDVEIFNDSELYTSLIDEVRLNITLPFKVISNNANNVDIETNTYTWIYKKNENLKNIDIKFDISKSAARKEAIGIYLLTGLIVIVLGTAGFAAYKYKNFNKI